MNAKNYKDIDFKINPKGAKVRTVVDIAEINIMNIVLNPGEIIPEHKTPVNVHFLVMEGKGTIVIGEEKRVCVAGDVVFSPLMISHALLADQNEVFSVFVMKTPNPHKNK